jgi:hypothetical protein
VLVRYQQIRAWVLSNCGTGEFERYGHEHDGSFGETDLLREHAWVVLASGFSEKMVRRVFSVFSLCFHDWSSAAVIVHDWEICRATALAVFNNPKKVNSILALSEYVHHMGFDQVKRAIEEDPVCNLGRLPGLGPVTAWHLAKNLGWDVAKPDRHLERITRYWGYGDAQGLCLDIAARTSDSVAQVDYVLWRYATVAGSCYLSQHWCDAQL